MDLARTATGQFANGNAGNPGLSNHNHTGRNQWSNPRRRLRRAIDLAINARLEADPKPVEDYVDEFLVALAKPRDIANQKLLKMQLLDPGLARVDDGGEEDDPQPEEGGHSVLLELAEEFDAIEPEGVGAAIEASSSAAPADC